MNFTINLDWWLLPLAVTIIAFTWFWRWSANQPPSGGYGAIGAAMGYLVVLGIVTIVSLVCWIVYLGAEVWVS